MWLASSFRHLQSLGCGERRGAADHSSIGKNEEVGPREVEPEEELGKDANGSRGCRIDGGLARSQYRSPTGTHRVGRRAPVL